MSSSEAELIDQSLLNENKIPLATHTTNARPQRLHSWFNLIPVDQFEKEQPERVLFLDSFVTVKTAPQYRCGYQVLFEGMMPMSVVVHIGVIFVWYGDDLLHPDRDFPKLYDELYSTQYITSKATIFENTHVMDFVENGSDNLHFKVVHLWNHSKLYDHQVTDNNITLKQETKFNYGSCSNNSFIRFMSKIIPELELTHDYVYHGPGLAVVGATGRGAPKFHALVSLTPEGEHRTRVYVTMALSPDTFPASIERLYQKLFPSKYLCDLLCSVMANYIKNEFDVDAVIWKHRKWLKEPRLLNSEAHLYDVIRWGETFYPKDFKYIDPPKKKIENRTWYYMADLEKISTNQLKTYSVAGRELVSYLDSEGELHIYDAYCPHQGAHLGHGGTIVDDCIRCPFHGFHFDQQGQCLGQSTVKRSNKLQNLDLAPIECRIQEGRVDVFIE